MQGNHSMMIQHWKQSLTFENQTFTAYFTATEQTYKVKYLDEDKNVEIHDMSDPKNAHFGDEIERLYREN